MIHRELTFYFFFMLISIALISWEKQGELRFFYKPEKALSLNQFKVALKSIPQDKKDYLNLWHSMLTGNTRGLSKPFKEKYKTLGLSHIFTPSGFHLSALLTPLRWVIPLKLIPIVMIVICILTFQLPGQDALKRMSLVKLLQNYLGVKSGFQMAIVVSLLIGQLCSSPLSFIFSCFFLGVIYSGLKGISLIIWFFIGQILISFLSGEHISFLNILFSPMANLLLSLITPLLFFLSFPLGDMQLRTGLFMIEAYDSIISLFYEFMTSIPMVEVHSFTMLALIVILLRAKRTFLIALILYSSSLNLEEPKPFKSHRYYFAPQKEAYKFKIKEGEIVTYFKDGKCVERLRMGIWENRCSPKRAPIRKSIKKLSYL